MMLISIHMFTVITLFKTEICLLCSFETHWLYYSYHLRSGKKYDQSGKSQGKLFLELGGNHALVKQDKLHLNIHKD